MLFQELEAINSRPQPFEFYTASELWTDEHTSKKMLSFHLDESVDLSSRNAKFIRQSVDWIVSRCGLSSNSSVVDFGCGPGLYTTQLAERHIKVTGIDFSQRSIQYAIAVAEKNGLPISYVHRNYLEFESEERFDLILMIMCDFCALSPAQRKTMLDKFSLLLKPNGHVLLDVHSLAGFVQREEAAGYELNQLNGFWSPKRYYGFFNTFKYEEEKVVLDKYAIVESDRIRTIYNWLQYFSPETIKTEFSNSGLKVTDIYSDVAGKPFDAQSTEFAVVAERL
ncbi:MAG: class I SAM-dependent methyltransferase [Chloroflexales bacterium]|nr:class I SAM-dependent methyltransferase [Chloroflexales bacterium]